MTNLINLLLKENVKWKYFHYMKPGQIMGLKKILLSTNYDWNQLIRIIPKLDIKMDY